MSKDIKMSECCSCGFKWPTGQHGEHSCTSYLSADNKALKDNVAELEDALCEVLTYLNTCNTKWPRILVSKYRDILGNKSIKVDL